MFYFDIACVSGVSLLLCCQCITLNAFILTALYVINQSSCSGVLHMLFPDSSRVSQISYQLVALVASVRGYQDPHHGFYL